MREQYSYNEQLGHKNFYRGMHGGSVLNGDIGECGLFYSLPQPRETVLSVKLGWVEIYVCLRTSVD